MLKMDHVDGSSEGRAEGVKVPRVVLAVYRFSHCSHLTDSGLLVVVRGRASGHERSFGIIPAVNLVFRMSTISLRPATAVMASERPLEIFSMCTAMRLQMQ